MATDVLEIINIPEEDEDEEIRFLYSTNKGTSKSDPISVDNYTRANFNFNTYNNNNNNNILFDDDLEILDTFPQTLTKRVRILKGESSNSKPDTKPETKFMCEICADEKPSNEKFRILGCGHSYCSDCMRSYIGSKIQENITNVSCPVPGCFGYLEPQHCHSILPKQVFDRWGDALCEAVILGSERFYCPYKDCSSLLIDERVSVGGSGVIIESECPDCHRLFCVQCKVPWHSGIECGEFQKLKKDERSNEDIMLMKLAKSKKWIRCPKCKFYVERTAGCLFIKCRCQHSFCYNCGAPLKDHYCKNCKH